VSDLQVPLNKGKDGTFHTCLVTAPDRWLRDVATERRFADPAAAMRHMMLAGVANAQYEAASDGFRAARSLDASKWDPHNGGGSF